MTNEKIQKRMDDLRAEYEKLMEEMQKVNNTLQQMAMRKTQIEGAFNELSSLIEDDKDKADLKVVEK